MLSKYSASKNSNKMKITSNGIKLFQCKICLRMFPNIAKLNAHLCCLCCYTTKPTQKDDSKRLRK